MGALQEFVDNFTYLGGFVVLLLGSLGAHPGGDAHRGRRVEPRGNRAVVASRCPSACWACGPAIWCSTGSAGTGASRFSTGDWPGWVLSPAREQWLKAAYRRHALKTVVMARHVMGLRAAAFLTAGSAGVPFWNLGEGPPDGHPPQP